MFEKTRFSGASMTNPVEAETRMMTMVERNEKWNSQKKASKCYHLIPLVSHLLIIFSINNIELEMA